MRVIAEGTIRPWAGDHARASASLGQWVKVVSAVMKTAIPTGTGSEFLAGFPKDYTRLCQRDVPRPLPDAAAGNPIRSGSEKDCMPSLFQEI